MKEITKKFLNLFFNEGEQICFSANKYAYPSESQSNLNEEATVLVAINPIEGQRNDENVTAYRTFMIELDDMSLENQLNYVKLMEFPYSYCCFSGNKSLHFAIVLDHDIPSDTIYRHTYQWILNIMEQADQNTKNPSRSVRFPGVIRPDTGKEQRVVHMGERISLETLSKWLNKHPHKAPAPLIRKKGRSTKANIKGIKPWAKEALKEGVHNMDGSRNKTWMSLGCELALNGFNLDDTIYYLGNYFEEQPDFKESEWLTAVRSGWNYADKINR
jgi:hypothetical protein